MFRTRDLVLFFVVVLFLVLAIGLTLIKQSENKAGSFQIPKTSTEISGAIAQVEILDDDSVTREERLKQLREKIKNRELTITSDVILDEPDAPKFGEETPEVVVGELMKCADYVEGQDFSWPTGVVKSEFIEGVRQYYTEREVSLSTTSTTTQMERKVLLTMSTQFVPFGAASCLSSDVIGIALDGSLIRNSEATLYSVFGSQTLIGYALDGFPIYGLGVGDTDGCGGRILQGLYRYELSSERPTIISCFAEQPQSLGT